MKFIEVYKDTYYINDNNIVKAFLLVGSKKALLIDTCMNINNIKELIKEVTDLPVRLINTHCDRDHIGANKEFEEVYLHELELANFLDNNLNQKILYVKEDDIIDLGQRQIKIIEIKGHTEGSIGIIDIDNKVLFSGDAIQDYIVYMFGKHRNMQNYIEGLKNMNKHLDEFDTIYPSHGSMTLNKEIINELIVGATKVLNKEIQPIKKVDVHGKLVDLYDVGCAGFYYE